jgi:hypothetical protein
MLTGRRESSEINGFDLSVTSDVVRQDFKRRLLKEVQYLLNQLNKRQSYAKVLRHVTDVLPPQQGRKRNICLELLETILRARSSCRQCSPNQPRQNLWSLASMWGTR